MKLYHKIMLKCTTSQLIGECMLTGGVLYCQVYSAMNEHPEAPTIGEVPQVKHPCASSSSFFTVYLS